MDYLFYQVAAVNGFDSIGHYLRAILVVNICSTYAVQPDTACTSKFSEEEATARSAKQQLDDGRSPALVRMDQVLRGADPDEVLGRDKAKGKAEDRGGDGRDGRLELPPAFLPGQAPADKPAAAPAPQPKPAEDPRQNAVEALLDYLLGDPLLP
jgi:hypothetical protein